MDYVTRQFINLTKKFRKELFIYSKLLHDDLQKNREAVAARNEREKQQDEIWEKWREEIFSKYEKSEGDHGTRDDRSYSVQNSIRWATWLAFVAAATYAAIAANQLHTAQSALKEAHDSSQRQLRMEQRAWLVFDTDYMDAQARPKVAAEVSVPIRLVNNGRTPALKIEGVVVADAIEPEKDPAFEYSPERPKTIVKSGILYPNFPSTSVVDSKYLLKKGLILKVHGRIEYDDIFHVRHWVTFCHVISSSPEGRTPKCVAQNNVDEIDE